MFTHEALQKITDFFLASTDVVLTYHLFKNNWAVDEDTQLADFTESDFPGYAPKAAVAEDLTAINALDEAFSVGATMTWTCNAPAVPPQQAFGMYVTFVDHNGTTCLFFAWTFSGPSTLAFAGDKVEKKMDWYTKNFNP